MTGYQARDHEVVDYGLWAADPAAGALRGPQVDLVPGEYIACLGAAQTFGPFCQRPFPALLGESLERPVLNLGIAGAGPRYFVENPRLLELADAAALVVVQVMSGRSEDNRQFRTGGRELLTRRSDGRQLGAEPAWADLIATESAEAVMALVEETRANWIESYRRLFTALSAPTILAWFSQREPAYAARSESVGALFGPFPQLIDDRTFAAIEPFADTVVRCVTRRGSPQPLVSRFTGLPVEVVGRADLGSRRFTSNHYYPSPEMHEDLSAALLGPARRLLDSAAVRHPTAVSSMSASPASVGPTPAVLTYRDVVVVPYTALLSHGDPPAFHRGGPRWPDWDAAPAARHHIAGRPVDSLPDPMDPVETIDGPVAWAGPVTFHFGHQITDFSMRLLPAWLAHPGITFLVAPNPGTPIGHLGQAPRFWVAIRDWLGIPATAFRLILRSTLVRELLVAPQAEQYLGTGPSPDHLDRMDALVAARLGRVHRTGTLFVSRAGERARMAGEAILEGAMRSAGVDVLRPEALPLEGQVSRYASAERIVFSEGSAIHGLQLLGRGLGDITIVHRVPNRDLREPNIVPRARTLTYLDAIEGMVHGVRRNGSAEIAVGITLLDPERLVEGLRDVVPGLGDHLDRAAFRQAQEEDVMRWLRTLEARFTGLPGSVDHLIDTLADAGLGRLVPAARIALR